MDYKYIEQLLERYWDCETTIEEESILRTFFSQKDVPARLLKYRSLFEYQKQSAASEPLGDEFDSKVLAAIEYTRKELSFLTHDDAAWPIEAKMTGAQVYELVERSLAAKHGYGVVCNDSTLYVSSGFEMDISRTKEGGYKLNKLTRRGSECRGVSRSSPGPYAPSRYRGMRLPSPWPSRDRKSVV